MNDVYSRGDIHGQDTEAINDFFDDDHNDIQGGGGYHDTPAIKMRQINPMVDQ